MNEGLEVSNSRVVKSGILMVGNFLSEGRGSRQVCQELAERFSEMKWNVITTSSRENKVLRLFDMLKTAWRERDNYEIALMDIFSGPAFIWAEAVGMLLRKIQKKYVLTLHGGYLPEFSRRWPGRVRKLLQTAEIVTTPSRFLYEKMSLYRKDLRLLPNPIDLDRYRFHLREQARPKLIWLRSFHQIYNPQLAIEVTSRIRAVHERVELIMIGPDKGDGSLEATRTLIIKNELEDVVQIVGGISKSEVPRWLNQGDVFLNTTNIDNAPVSVIEAMACGLCVVSTNVGGIVYLLRDGQDSLLVPPGRPGEMEKAVLQILNNNKLARTLSENGRKKAINHGWTKVLPRWREILDEALDHSSTSGKDIIRDTNDTSRLRVSHLETK